MMPKRLVRVLNPAQTVGKFIRQSGPPGRCGVVDLLVEPCDDDGLKFEWAVAETDIPHRFSEAVLRGIHCACTGEGPWGKTFMPEAPFQGCEFTRTKVRVIGGAYHEIDSKESCFVIASALAFADAVEKAG